MSKTPRGHSAVNLDPWTSSTWRKPWNKHHTPNKVTKDKLSRFTQQKTHRGISLNKTAGRQGWSKRSNWSPRPNKGHNPRAFGLISGPCMSLSSRQQKLNRVRKEEASPNPRKRIREATPFNLHDAPVVINSDDEEEQERASPTSPPDHEKGHPAVYKYQPKSHQCILLLVKAPMKRTSAAYLTWQHQLKRCPQSLTYQMTQDMKHKVLSLLMSMQTRTVSRTRTDRKHWSEP